MPRCTATTRAGKRCKHNQADGSLFCVTHKNMKDGQAGDGWEGIDDILADTFDLSGDEIVETSDATISLNLVNNPQQPVLVEPQQTSEFNLDAMLEEVTMKLEQLNKVKKLLKNASAEVETKAKLMFYHANKTNPDLMNELRTKLKTCGLYLVKNNKEIIPYTFVKEYTDNAFNAMNPVDKKPYYDRVRGSMVCKVHAAQRLLAA